MHLLYLVHFTKQTTEIWFSRILHTKICWSQQTNSVLTWEGITIWQFGSYSLLFGFPKLHLPTFSLLPHSHWNVCIYLLERPCVKVYMSLLILILSGHSNYTMLFVQRHMARYETSQSKVRNRCAYSHCEWKTMKYLSWNYLHVWLCIM